MRNHLLAMRWVVKLRQVRADCREQRSVHFVWDDYAQVTPQGPPKDGGADFFDEVGSLDARSVLYLWMYEVYYISPVELSERQQSCPYGNHPICFPSKTPCHRLSMTRSQLKDTGCISSLRLSIHCAGVPHSSTARRHPGPTPATYFVVFIHVNPAYSFF